VVKNEYNLRLSRGETSISTGLATPEEAKVQQVLLPASTLVSDQLTYLVNNEALENTCSVFRSDPYHLTLIT
jgi:DNA-binding GntR family transcriptional regulator